MEAMVESKLRNLCQLQRLDNTPFTFLVWFFIAILLDPSLLLLLDLRSRFLLLTSLSPPVFLLTKTGLCCSPFHSCFFQLLFALYHISMVSKAQGSRKYLACLSFVTQNHGILF